ncbi:expressed unknown protein [Seminavis robusta]|uniref:F-box domain-containing protein n=1 Tax=Seminavis robusta TaxID=568900 RepID=A0A9N8DBY3_9STRA|nr:expressed unknown protein [Seminavis robusta]|eukprot:Sro71_g039280.1 n/a (299) ;mRNA; r:35134-36030
MSINANSTLSTLPDGVLSNVFTYLNPQSVLSVESTAKGLAGLTDAAWVVLEGRIPPLQKSKAVNLSPKQRVARYEKLNNYCLQIAGMENHQLPNLCTDVYGNHPASVDGYEFFVRITQKRHRHVWEGFVPARPNRVLRGAVDLDMSEVFQAGCLNTSSGRTIEKIYPSLKKFLKDPFAVGANTFAGNRGHVRHLFQNILVIVAVVPYNDPKAAPRLVLSTWGLTRRRAWNGILRGNNNNNSQQMQLTQKFQPVQPRKVLREPDDMFATNTFVCRRPDDSPQFALELLVLFQRPARTGL